MKKQKPYMIDVNTPNISFVQTAVDLKKLGIKTNTFFLRLYDPSLKGVDPHSPFLTDEQMIRIINECMVNPWYFLRECVRIPVQGNPSGIPYLLNRANLAATWCFINGIDNYQVIPRQIGKTESTISILDWAFLLGTTNSEFMFLNFSEERSIANLSKLKDQRDLLPKYLQFKVAYDDDFNEIKGSNNIKTLKNANNGNSIVTKPSARSTEKAEKIGRGSTQPIQYMDEFEFIDYIKTIMEAAGPAFNTASENAQKNHGMYGRIITSTPGDLDAKSGIESLEIIEETCKFTESFYDMPIDEVKEYITVNSGNGIVYIEYQYQQLGKDEAWFNKVCKLLNNNKLKIKREIFLKRMHGSQLSPYEPEDLEAIQDLKGTIKEELFINRIFKLDVYETLDPRLIYFIGVDVAGGYGADNSAVTVWNPYTLKTVAEFKSPNIGVKGLIKFIYILVKKYLPKSILAIERNYNGEAILDHLRDTDIRGNLYFDNTKDPTQVDEKLDAAGFIAQEAARRRLYGIWTGGKSRELMYSLLESHIKDHKDGFVGEFIIDDLMKLVRTRTGKIEAQTGFHDDNIMSFLMCLYLYYYGNNLSRYGFSKGHKPTEDEANKGLYYTQNIYNALSETDREYFGITEDNPQYDFENLDTRSMIETNSKGLISGKELHDALNDMDDSIPSFDTVNLMKKMDPYSMKVYMEMQQAQKESESFNKRVNFVSSYSNLDNVTDDSDEYDFDAGLFNELNN